MTWYVPSRVFRCFDLKASKRRKRQKVLRKEGGTLSSPETSEKTKKRCPFCEGCISETQWFDKERT